MAKDDGQLASWGRNTDDVVSDTPAGNDFNAVAAGENFSIACDAYGVFGWGNNSYGQCDGPAEIGFIKLAAGKDHALALHGDGHIAAWGRQATPPEGNDLVAFAL